MKSNFQAAIRQQLEELESAKSADDVMRILGPDRNPYGPEWDGMASDAEGFFAGGDGTDVRYALIDAGWSQMWAKAPYHYAMRAPDGSWATYIEGDIYRGNKGGA
ncbi:hypothetical protein [Streptomyces tsukubensis]|uniref:hypothetical protein n=1 Tax=Streptomyces tsukubensis TaxID=83656 RepID=UPI00344BF0F4